MKIEVGKKYLNGYGDVVEITSYSPEERYPYTGLWDDDPAATYTEDGVFDMSARGRNADLVCELGTGLRVYTAEAEGHGESADWAAPADPAPAFSSTQVSRLLDALNMARNGCSCKEWTDVLVALKEALCPEDGKESQ